MGRIFLVWREEERTKQLVMAFTRVLKQDATAPMLTVFGVVSGG